MVTNLGFIGVSGAFLSIDAKHVTGISVKDLSTRDDYFVDIVCTGVSVFEQK